MNRIKRRIQVTSKIYTPSGAGHLAFVQHWMKPGQIFPVVLCTGLIHGGFPSSPDLAQRMGWDTPSGSCRAVAHADIQAAQAPGTRPGRAATSV